MHYYYILLSKKFPVSTLIYKSEMQIPRGQLVTVQIRNKDAFGVVLEQIGVEKIDFDKDKVNHIHKIHTYQLPSLTLKFIKLFSANSFNAANLILEACMLGVLSLGKKELYLLFKEIEDQDQLDSTNLSHIHTLDKSALGSKEAKISYSSFDLDTDVYIRIMAVIRTYFNVNISDQLETSSELTKEVSNKLKDNTTSTMLEKNILIIFPEKKMLTKYLDRIQLDKTIQEDLPAQKINILSFTGEKSKESKKAIKHVVSSYLSNIVSPSNFNPKISKPTINLIFTTRSGLFLPFKDLDRVILVDEANSFYIQEQNSLYYDTREVVLFLQQAYQCYINFVSFLPSIRLYNFQNKAVSGKSLTNKLATDTNPISIKITEFDKRFTKNSLFGPEVEKLLIKEE